MNRKPLPPTATVPAAVTPVTANATTEPQPQQPLEWETQTAPKRSFFSKPAFLGASEKNSEAASIKTGTNEIRTNNAKSRPFSGFLAHNRKKKLILIGIGALLLFIFILGLGLGLGLKKKGKISQSLPLPGSSQIFTGDLTYYSPGPGYGACGFENTSHDKICAVSHLVWDAVSTSSNPNLNPLCGKKIRITRFDAAKGRNSSVDVEVVDRCTGCKAEDVDLSLDMFTALADEGQGRVVGSWAWLD
ncbi:Barwin-like endoglucanase [Glarea lozoyensis ATCC 20868]|uniref:Barwin-like endoglucanase n=1 Tax=Glarea lozoyensis (strain ATCC 20868 / MF5171) TaxID=1116229 RepID=S3D0X7_GLAL2|nr:Barwin-like endoglucanase [Glarea lozoyensis ATCC 20868]EPE32182.1 Barwin-like endoglucanase [Glarea lozoyensis ATCC 20868]